MRRVFLDMDGVLADFDAGCMQRFGAHPAILEARGELWPSIDRAGAAFWTDLPKMPGADALLVAVRYTGLPTSILTAVPHTGHTASISGKRAWAAQHLPGVPVDCCRRVEKVLRAAPGDILVDDNRETIQAWGQAGGVGVLWLERPDWMPDNMRRLRSALGLGEAASCRELAERRSRPDPCVSKRVCDEAQTCVGGCVWRELGDPSDGRL